MSSDLGPGLPPPNPAVPPTGASPGWAWLAPWTARWPGLLLCAVIAMAASLVSRLHGGPQLLYALLMGAAFHFLHADARFQPGVAWCTGFVLRLGVALLGVRITLDQVAGLGATTAAAVMFCVVTTVLLGVALARRLGMGPEQGLLSGGATAICGASAALAIAAVLPRSPAQERFTVLVVVTVTALSTVAMLAYPLLAHMLGLSPRQAGVFLGGSIHDVAQVVAAGYLLGPETGDVATVVKLSRVALLAGVVAVATVAWRSRSEARAGLSGVRPWALVPGFLWLFMGLVVLQSMHWIPPAVVPAMEEVSRDALVLAIAGLGIKTSFQALSRAGWRPLVLMLAETAWLAAVLLLILATGVAGQE